MLLNHTSGLFDYLDDSAVLKAFTGQDTRVWTPWQVLDAAVAHPPLFVPGTQYSYSNTNYLLLGLIAEKVTGKSLADLVQQRISGPLHLRATYLITGADHRDNPTLAHGYEPDADRLAPLLPLAELQQMRTTVPEGPDTPNRRYGLGLEQVVTPCGTVWGHDGQVPGYSSEAYTDSTGRRTVSVFAATIFGIADPTSSAAHKTVVNAAVRTMLDKPIPATATDSD